MARKVSGALSIAQQVVERLRSRIPVTEAYLFGSQLDGTATEDSDIDIAAFSPAADSMRYDEKIALIVDIEKQVGGPIDLHVFGDRCLSEARPTNLFGYIRAHGQSLL
jgi:predicted nucleotidyltransferase